MKSICYLGSFILVAALAPVLADESKEQSLKFTTVNNKTITEDTTRRNVWSLSKEDWTRYKNLMNGIRGSISPENISPIEVLGTHARTEQERQKYAEIWARMRHEDVTRILAFQRAYNEAYQKLYPNEKLIDTRLLKREETAGFKAGDRVLVFVKIKQCPECEQMIQKLMFDAQVKNSHIDIYFIDTQNKKDDNRIRQWAQLQQIDKSRLQSGAITLNHDNGNLYRITKSVINPVPMVFKVNAQAMTQIQY